MKPVLQALVLADRVYQDVTGKKIIAGTFNTYWFSTKPQVREIAGPDGKKQRQIIGGTHAGSPFAYISLTDVCDGTKLELQFVDLTRNRTLFGTAGIINNPQRLSAIELIFALPVLPIQHSGMYAIEVICEGEILGSYRITAKNLDEKGTGAENGDSGT